MVNYIEPNLQEIIFGPIRVGLITQKQFWDHLKIAIPGAGPPTVSANIESFATRSIAAKLNLMKDLDYQNQAEELERVIKNYNNATRKLVGEISKLTPTPTASKPSASKGQSKAAEKTLSADDAKKLEEFKNKLTAVKEQKVKLKHQLKDLILKMLDTFRGYITEDLRHSWDDIISSKYDTVTWTNLQGEEEETELEYNLESFEMIWVFWMRTVFQEDAAEQHQEYLTHCIRFPYWLQPRKFANRKRTTEWIHELPAMRQE
jgi:small-conductance mechanosensitive channel